MAGKLTVTAYVAVRGPLTDGSAKDALQQWQENTAKALADEGTETLAAWPMDKTGRAHGGFQANLHPMRRDIGTYTITGPMIRGVTWAPWLEGVSKRNKSTGFGGYHLFRKTRLQLQKHAQDVGQAELDKIMPALGGT